ncbi:ATP-binding cassette domain-containing protein [Candidatus Dojkabacteria bacterium]|nr:ATP-binding cassette domain-containing protein [Candidatus Dojkabacteria bacterium]
MEVISVKNLSRSFNQYKKATGLLGSIKSLLKRNYFKVSAVSDISFSIDAGEIVGFIGPNGAGKTTTLKMLSGILYPTSGQVQVLGHTPTDRKREFQEKIALVMGQKSQLIWDLPAKDSFMLNKHVYNIPENTFKNSVLELSSILEIEDILEIPVKKLSLGQRMKCELLASILHGPQILFLDEPTIGLDVVVQKKVREFIKEYNETYKTTVILTSHYMDDVKELCKRIIVISKGSIVFDGEISTLVKKYATHKYLKLVFTKSVNREDIQVFGKITDSSDDGFSYTLSVPEEGHVQIASQILQKLPVDDIDISEVELEDIIRKIFANSDSSIC